MPSTTHYRNISKLIALFKLIEDYQKQNRGESPTYEDIISLCPKYKIEKVNSKSHAKYLLGEMAKLNMTEPPIKYRSRSIRLITQERWAKVAKQVLVKQESI